MLQYVDEVVYPKGRTFDPHLERQASGKQLLPVRALEVRRPQNSGQGGNKRKLNEPCDRALFSTI